MYTKSRLGLTSVTLKGQQFYTRIYKIFCVGGNNMIVERENGVILYNIYFEKIDVYLNCATGFLLSSDMKFLSIDKDANDKLLNKFNICSWDDYADDLFHIKFLVKYSPILSKFIDLSEFNEIEFCNPDLSINKRYCLKINDKNIFSTRDLDYERIGIQMDPYLKKLLMKEDSNNDN